MEGPSHHGFPPNSKLERFHNIVETKLKVTLKSVLEARDKIFDEHSEYIKLRNNIAVVRESKQTELESLVNLGSEFYSQAVVPDPSRIVVDVGLTLHVEFTLDEAIEFCKKKEEHLKRYHSTSDGHLHLLVSFSSGKEKSSQKRLRRSEHTLNWYMMQWAKL
mmetsp:Transcript_44518/g.71552  ORF Transcript_44518/g.71552 Transcript_44518/m.71552 type:complete len:162 (+) Transcript_44518:101-586(+)